jgi:hypothetical protein
MKRPSLHSVIGHTVAALALVVAAGGCAKTQYRGAEPSARTFHEDANPRDYYVGMDLLFSIDQDTPHVPAAHRMEPDFR